MDAIKRDLDKERESLYKKIQSMSVSAKIKLALLGNKEARDLLIKDPNKIISSSVLKNPRVTEEEVLKVVKSKSTQDTVLRLISMNKGFLKNYPIKLGLVTNPKTPSAISLKLIKDVRGNDINKLSRSRNIPRIIRNMAQRMLERKK